MSLTLLKSVTAMGVNGVTTVGATGGTAPYTYSLIAGGAGGTLVPQLGGGAVYTAPAMLSDDPRAQFATIRVTDDVGDTAEGSILITDALGLIADIIQTELSLAPGRVWLYNQKVNQPTDDGLYVIIGVLTLKPFGNTNKAVAGSGVDSQQSVNMYALLSVDVISRGLAALRRKEEILMALASTYAQKQQEQYSFRIGKLPPGSQFVNLSRDDGAAIPYRFNITVGVQYMVKKAKPVEYYSEFSVPTVETED